MVKLRPIKMRTALLAFLVLIYLFFVAGLSMIVDHLILFPSRQSVSSGQAVRQVLPGTELEVWSHKSAQAAGKPKVYILHFIGNASRAEWDRPIYLDVLGRTHGAEAWVLNYPGYGGSGGEAHMRDFPAAAEKAYAAIQKEAGKSPLLISGTSIGTTSALYLGSRHRPIGLILLNPPPLKSLILGRYGWWNLWLIAAPVASMIPDELNSLETAPRSLAPAVFLTSELDRTVPPNYQRKVIASYGGEKRQLLLPGAGHNTDLPEELESKTEAALQWLLQKGI